MQTPFSLLHQKKWKTVGVEVMMKQVSRKIDEIESTSKPASHSSLVTKPADTVLSPRNKHKVSPRNKYKVSTNKSLHIQASVLFQTRAGWALGSRSINKVEFLGRLHLWLALTGNIHGLHSNGTLKLESLCAKERIEGNF